MRAKRRLTRHSALTYWDNWAIATKDSKGVFRYRLIIGEPRKSIKEIDAPRHLDRVATGTFKYIRDLITESPYNLLDPDIQRFLLHDMMMLSFRAPYDPDARGELDKINDALKGGGTQGKDSPGKLMEIIERDIAYYRRVLKSGGAKVRNLPDSITIDRAEQICRAYKGIMEKLAPIIPDIEDRFAFLNICKEHIDKPFAEKQYKEYYFLKGDIYEENGKTTIRADF